MTSAYNADLTTFTELDINIPLLGIHKDWQWG